MAAVKAFSVVFFPSDNSIEVIPSKWLSLDKTNCPFPKVQPIGFKDLQADPNSSPSQEWPVWIVEIKTSYDSFNKCHKKAQKLLKKDDVESTDTEESSRRQLNFEFPEVLEAPEGQLRNAGDGYLAVHQQNQENQEIEIQPNATFDSDNPEGGTFLPIQLLDPNIKKLLDEFRAFQEVSLQNQLSMARQIKDLKELVLCHISVNSLTPKVGVKWPLSTQTEFDTAEELLMTATTFESETHLLSCMEGSNVTKTTNNIMKFMISQDLALKLRMTKASGKIVFGGTVCNKLARASVRKSYLDKSIVDPKIVRDINDNHLDSVIAKWLRDSIGRGEDGKKRRAATIDGKKDKESNGPEPVENTNQPYSDTGSTSVDVSGN